jgi:hypothetical protein
MKIVNLLPLTLIFCCSFLSNAQHLATDSLIWATPKIHDFEKFDESKPLTTLNHRILPYIMCEGEEKVLTFSFSTPASNIDTLIVYWLNPISGAELSYGPNLFLSKYELKVKWLASSAVCADGKFTFEFAAFRLYQGKIQIDTVRKVIRMDFMPKSIIHKNYISRCGRLVTYDSAIMNTNVCRRIRKLDEKLPIAGSRNGLDSFVLEPGIYEMHTCLCNGFECCLNIKDTITVPEYDFPQLAMTIPDSMANGKSYLFEVDFDRNNNEGLGWYAIRYPNSSDSILSLASELELLGNGHDVKVGYLIKNKASTCAYKHEKQIKGFTHVGILQAEKSLFELYPNPVQHILNLKVTEPIAEHWISDIAGKEFFVPNRIEGNIATFDLSELQSGTYYLKVTTKSNKTQTETFVKQ